MKTEIIRAYMLEPGDQFIKLGITYKVIHITSTKIICRYLYTSLSGDRKISTNVSEMGANSQERIQLIVNPDQPSRTSGQLVINFKPFKKLNHGINFENRNEQTN